MSFLFNNAEPLESTLLKWLENPVPSSVLSASDNKPTLTTSKSNSKQDARCYYGDSNAPSLEFFYGKDIPKNGKSCENGLFSIGNQTQMHPVSILYRVPYLHPIGIIYSLLFLWSIHFRIRIITIITIIFIQFTIGESMKIHRHASLQNVLDKIKIMAALIGDILLIPFQIFIFPTENPLIQFQNTSINRYIFSHCKSMLKFTPTFWARNIFVQFILCIFEEQYASTKHCKIYRELIQTNDGGLVALDYWVNKDAECKDENKAEEKGCEQEFAHFGDVYKSKYFYQYNSKVYNKYHFPKGKLTPILFIFTTYCGDSMSAPVHKMAEYFCLRGWRVICYTKRGCGSPYYEMLPLLTHETFDLQGMDDAKLVINRIQNRYPAAHKICSGFSLGGSQVHDFLATLNRKHKYFIGGIKIDGVCSWLEMIKFNSRLNLVSKVLGEVVHSNYIKSLGYIKKEKETRIDFDKINGIKSAACEMVDIVENIMAPTNGYINNIHGYLHSVGPMDIERINVPLLVFNSWNDGFQDPDDMPIGVANINPNIFHCITRLGAHCVRREGILNKHCWQSKVSFEFAEAVVNANANHK